MSKMLTATGSLGLIANVMQLIFICRDKKQRKSVFGMILLSLCVADIIVSIVFLQFSIIGWIFLRDMDWNFLMNHYEIESQCNMVRFFSLTSSFCHVVFIAVVRVLAEED